MAKPKAKHKTAAKPERKSFGASLAEFWTRWRWVILAFAAGRIIMWLCYPDPLMLTDTGEFVLSSQTLRHNPYKPIGYSLFVALTNTFVPGTTALIFFQMLLRLITTLVFLSVLRRHWNVPGGVLTALGVLCGLEPLGLLCDQLLLSDSVFVSFVLLVFAALLRYVKEPNNKTALMMWGSLSLAMLVRHNGLFYFAIVVLLILALRARGWLKHAGIVIGGFCLVVLTIMWRFKHDQGVFALTAFDGWATYGSVAAMIDSNPSYYNALDPELKHLYEYFATAPDSIYHPPRTDNWYRWSPDAPAKKYLYATLKQNPGMQYHEGYVRTNDALRKLSHDIILHRPGMFLTEFYLPNLLCATLWPTVEDADTRLFNYSGQRHEAIATVFHEDTSTWRARFHLFGTGAYVLPVWVAVWWILALWGLTQAIIQKGARTLHAWLFSDLRALLMAALFVLTPIMAVSHHFYLRYATSNMPFLMLVGILTLAPHWTRRTEDEITPAEPQTTNDRQRR